MPSPPKKKKVRENKRKSCTSEEILLAGICWVLANVWPEVSDCILYDLSADAQICFAQTKTSRGIAAATENKPSKTVLLATCAAQWLTVQLQQTSLPALFMMLGGCTGTTGTSIA